MNEKALKTLEYDKIIELLEGFATSPMGKYMCRRLTHSEDLEEIEVLQQETADALARVYQKGSLSFGGVKDISVEHWEPESFWILPVFWKMPAGQSPIPGGIQRMCIQTLWTPCLKFWNLSLLCPQRSAAVSCLRRKSQMMPVRDSVRSAGI